MTTRDRLLLTGADGYVGQRLADTLRATLEVVAVGRAARSGLACDMASPDAVAALAFTPFRATSVGSTTSASGPATARTKSYTGKIDTMTRGFPPSPPPPRQLPHERTPPAQAMTRAKTNAANARRRAEDCRRTAASGRVMRAN